MFRPNGVINANYKNGPLLPSSQRHHRRAPPRTPTRMQPLNVPPPPLTLALSPEGEGCSSGCPFTQSILSQSALRGGELLILGDNQESDDLQS